MPEEQTTPSAPGKKTKKTAMPEAPPESKEPEVPSAQEVRAAKKAELVAFAERLGLDTEGKVDDLRKRILERIEKAEKVAEGEKEEAVEKKPGKPSKPVKEKKVPERAAKKEKPKKEEAGEEEAEEEYEPKQKPTLDARMKTLLELRAATSAARPRFRRQEWFRYRKFADEWRKPQGGQSKLRRHFGYRWNLPSIGYRGPREVRGLHPSGFQEVLIHNPRQLEGLDPAKQAVRIAHAVGARKRELIEKACEEKGLRVLNRMVSE
jgi:large subunit ribosomal protein L32e